MAGSASSDRDYTSRCAAGRPDRCRLLSSDAPSRPISAAGGAALVAHPPPGVLEPLSPGRALLALGHSTPELLRRVLWPWSLLRRSLSIPAGLDFGDRRWLEVELPAGNGVGTARAIARAYAALAAGGGEIGITPETFARLTAPPDVKRLRDEVLGIPSYFSLGFLRPGPDAPFGSSPRALGAPGAGGSFGFADPDARLGYAYVMNKLDFWLVDDPRETSLRDAVYRAIRRLDRPAPITVRRGMALVVEDR